MIIYKYILFTFIFILFTQVSFSQDEETEESLENDQEDSQTSAYEEVGQETQELVKYIVPDDPPENRAPRTLLQRSVKNRYFHPKSSLSGSDTSEDKPSKPLAAGESDTKLIPLPVYATLPNEGNTYGFLPVFLTVEGMPDGSQRTRSIIAPSISWNKTIRFTGTFRLYYYPSKNKTINFIPSISTRVNQNLTFEYFDMPRDINEWTLEPSIHLRRSIFYRFFGIGQETKNSDESSFTKTGGDIGGRAGYNLTRNLNIGARLTVEKHRVEGIGVPGIHRTTDLYPNAPGIDGAMAMFESLSIRYDSRENREFSEEGTAHELTAGIAQGIKGTRDFARVQLESRIIMPQTSWLSGAARAYWSYVGGPGDIPFYFQSTLGGSFRLRGFTEDRFIDKGAWTAEIEERIQILQTHIYGVTADWRIDPFVTVGHVYRDGKQFFRHIRAAAGLGFRAFVRPNVLGRVDTAVGGDGLKIYVELGYPF